MAESRACEPSGQSRGSAAQKWSRGASLVVRRLGDGARARSQLSSARARHAVMWVDVWCALAGGLGRMTEDCSAVLCLRPPRCRHMLRYLGVIAAGFVAAAVVLIIPPLVLAVDSLVWWAWAVIVGGAFLVLAIGLFRVAVRQARVNWPVRSRRSELRAARPRGGWYVYDFAGDPDRPGQGRMLLEGVCDEADRHGRVLCLDTLGQRPPGPSLVPYYAELGFVVAGDVDVVLAGEQQVQFLMVREPRQPRR